MGRRKALGTGKVTDPRSRALGNLLRDIAVISYKLPHIVDKGRFITQLQKLPQYKKLSRDMLRRDVDEAFVYAIRTYLIDAPDGYADALRIIALKHKRTLWAKGLQRLRTYLEQEHPELLPK